MFVMYVRFQSMSHITIMYNAGVQINPFLTISVVEGLNSLWTPYAFTIFLKIFKRALQNIC